MLSNFVTLSPFLLSRTCHEPPFWCVTVRDKIAICHIPKSVCDKVRDSYTRYLSHVTQSLSQTNKKPFKKRLNEKIGEKVGNRCINNFVEG